MDHHTLIGVWVWTIALWSLGVDHHTLIGVWVWTIALWCLGVDHRTLVFEYGPSNLVFGCGPSHFGLLVNRGYAQITRVWIEQ
jgi:hypothetical protein